MNKRILSFILILSVILATAPFVKTQKASAYKISNGQKEYSISTDKYVYGVNRFYTQTICTFEAWIKLPSNLSDDVAGGVIFGSYYNTPFGYAGCVDYAVTYGGHFYLYWNNGAYEHTFESIDLRNGMWTHVAIVKDVDKLYYYINGSLEETVNVALGESVTEYYYCVGSDWNNWYRSNQWNLGEKSTFMGQIKQVTVYSQPQSRSVIMEDMSKPHITTSMRGDSLMANYYFTEKWAKSDVVADDSDNGYDCRLMTVDKYVPVKEVTDFDYSFAVIPDMQAMTYHKPDNFRQQSQWLKDNALKLNLKFVSYVGDMVESNYSNDNAKSDAEWQIASSCIQMLDGVVPYTTVLGNHDYNDWARTTREAVLFNKYFKYSKYCQEDYFAGAFKEGYMDNYYITVNVGEIKYIIFALEYAPRYTVLNWVDAIAEENPDARIIITTHNLVEPNGLLTRLTDRYAPAKTIKYDSANCGTEMWEKLLRKRSNIFMTFSGHVCTDEVVVCDKIGDHGNLVRNILVNAQGAMFTSAMNTFLLVKVNERNKTMAFCYYSPEYDACYNYQSQFTLSFADANNPTVGL